jgi:shikimate kinase
MDEMISQKAGMSINEIVARDGWTEFRKIESEVARSTARLDNMVNATGGGVVTSQENLRVLKENGKLVWLRAKLETLLERTNRDSSRPSLTGKPPAEDMAQTLTEREPIYRRAADLIVDTDDLTPEAVVENIIKNLALEIKSG